MAALSLTISIITLNTNGLNIPIKRDWQRRFKPLIKLCDIYKKLISNIIL